MSHPLQNLTHRLAEALFGAGAEAGTINLPVSAEERAALISLLREQESPTARAILARLERGDA